MYKKLFIMIFLIFNIFIFSITFEEYEKQTNYTYTGTFYDEMNILVTHVFDNNTYDIYAWDSSDLNNIKSLYTGEEFSEYIISNDGLKLASIAKNNLVYVYDSEVNLNYVILKKASDVYFHPNGEIIIIKVINGDTSEFHFVDYKNNKDIHLLKYSEKSNPFSLKSRIKIFDKVFIISDFKANQDGEKYDINYIRNFSDPFKNISKFETSFSQSFYSIDKDWIYHYDNRLDAVSTNKIFLPEKNFSRITLGNIGKLLYPDLAYIDSNKDSRVKKYFALKHQIDEVSTGEYFLYDNKFILVNEFEIPKNVNVYGFDKKNSEHIYFSEGEIISVNSFNIELKKYIDPYFKNLELLNIGFENVVEDIIETMNIRGMEFLAYNEDRFFGDDLNTSYYNKTRLILEEIKSLLNKEKITNFDFNYVYKKIVHYSLMANYTKNFEEAEKAVQYFKNLKNDYPEIVNWDKLNKNLVLLEALTIANKTGTKEAYYHILDKEGLLYNEENELNFYIEKYPEIFINLLKDKKKLSYFSGIPEDKLASFENSYKAGEILDNKEEIYIFDDFLKNNKKNINDLM
ncbi:MAG: hypothetical protein ACQESN_09075 [Thermotogota bacterium]